MSDDEADPELLDLLRKSLGLDSSGSTGGRAPDTKVLRDAQFIFDNAIDVALDPTKTKEAAELIWRQMQEKQYSTQTWAEHELHPKTKDEATLHFIFTMDLLNFSFWSEEAGDESKRFGIEYRGRKWTGYWSLVAALQRALDEGRAVSACCETRERDIEIVCGANCVTDFDALPAGRHTNHDSDVLDRRD